MRIGIDCRLWEQTGVGRYTKNIVLNLQRVDLRNQYVLFVRQEDYKKVQALITNPKWKIVKTNIKWHSLSEQLKFPRIIKREKLDLMHFPYFSVPIFYNKPYVVTIHDLIINHFSTGKASTLFYPLYLVKWQAYKFVIEKAAKQAQKIITPSNATKQEIMEHFKISENKIDVIYEGANLRNQESKVKNQEFEKYFLYVGNAYPHKNLERLIKAFKDLTNDVDNLKLILVGQKDYFYQRLEKENLSDKIIFYGKASDKELVDLYQNAICLVAPSLMEGFGLPVLEAMSLKCLVLASNIPSFREVAADTAIYFDPKDESDIQLKLKEVLTIDEKQKQERLEKAYGKSKHFSWEKAGEQTLNIYESALTL